MLLARHDTSGLTAVEFGHRDPQLSGLLTNSPNNEYRMRGSEVLRVGALYDMERGAKALTADVRQQ